MGRKKKNTVVSDITADAKPFLRALNKKQLDADVIRDEAMNVLQALIADASGSGVTDILLRPAGEEVDILFATGDRISEQRIATWPLSSLSAIVDILELSTAISRSRQEWSRFARLGPNDMEVRISSLPSIHGNVIGIHLIPSLEDIDSHSADFLSTHRNDDITTGALLSIVEPQQRLRSALLYSLAEELRDEGLLVTIIEHVTEQRLTGIHQIECNMHADEDVVEQVRSAMDRDTDVIVIDPVRSDLVADLVRSGIVLGQSFICGIASEQQAAQLRLG